MIGEAPEIGRRERRGGGISFVPKREGGKLPRAGKEEAAVVVSGKGSPRRRPRASQAKQTLPRGRAGKPCLALGFHPRLDDPAGGDIIMLCIIYFKK